MGVITMEVVHCADGAGEKPAIVFITYSGLGDLIAALPLLLSLRSRFDVLPVIRTGQYRQWAGMKTLPGFSAGMIC